MAGPLNGTEVGAWRGEGVHVGQVLEALEGLRRGEERMAAGEGPSGRAMSARAKSNVMATRTSVVTLVAVAEDGDDVERAAAATQRLTGRHPGRTITLVLGERARLDAEVRLHQTPTEGVTVWSEEVRLSVGGEVLDHLDSLIEPLTLPDLPVAVWYVGGLPDPGDCLLTAADVVLVDTKEAVGWPLAQVLDIDRRRPVVDLSWIRLQPWRQLLGGLFEGAAYRPFVAGVRSAEVRGKEGPRRLLAGWLASRLGLPRSAFHLEDARHVTIRLVAEHEGRRGVFTVERVVGERAVRAAASVDNGPHHTDVLPLPDESLPWSLAEALTHLRRNRRHEDAVRAALSFAP